MILLVAFFFTIMEMKIETEQWRDVIGFEDCYEVSNLGRVKRKKGITIYKNGSVVRFKETVLKPCTFKKGYKMVYLSKNSKKKTKSLHRIVAEAWIENPFSKETVNHINCDKADNRVSNLEWMSNEENIKHAIENGRYIYREELRIKNNRKIRNQFSDAKAT